MIDTRGTQVDKGRRDRVRASTIALAAALAALTVAYVVGSAVAGLFVPGVALQIALVASWACLVVLALLPRVVEVPGADAAVAADEAAGTRGVDPVTALLRYESAFDDVHVRRANGQRWAVLVVEVDAYVAAAGIDPSVADALVVRASERISVVAASYGAIVRRLAGPQFVVIVVGLEDAALSALATTLHDSTTSDAALDAGKIGRIGRLVVGVAVSKDGRGDVSHLIRSAGAATSQAKRLGSDGPVFFHDRLADEAWERIAVGRALTAAIDHRDIDLVYQPQVDLADGSLLAVEVLARWHDPVFGPIEPDRFVQIANELGLGGQLDRLIFEKALQQLRAWDTAGIRVPRICVNTTPETISDGGASALGDLLATYAVSPDRVTVEIVESRVFEGDDGKLAVQHYRDLGLRVALDDFGRGPSSFSQLVALPVTGLKIDRSLLGDHDADPSVLAAIIQAGTALGLTVGAVGVETAAQRDLLVRLGCTVGQGYLFSRPLSAEELPAWLGALSLAG